MYVPEGLVNYVIDLMWLRSLRYSMMKSDFLIFDHSFGSHSPKKPKLGLTGFKGYDHELSDANDFFQCFGGQR